MKKVLVTGAHGFLGRHTAQLYKKKGYEVYGIGHGPWGEDRPRNFGIDHWIESDIDITNLLTITEKLDCIVHCAGGSTVGASVTSPLGEFQKTVTSAIHVLEYARTKQPNVKLVFISSAAVYGEKEDELINESEDLTPVSPYGFYKKMTEELCESYAVNFNISVSVIRFFSIYGTGLRKQLLWDACNKLSSGNKRVTFFGTGKETRDWLHVSDATSLIYFISLITCNKFFVANGGSGERVTVFDMLLQLRKLLGVQVEIVMNGSQKEGDPKHFCASIEKLRHCGWQPKKLLADGLKEYVSWFKEANSTDNTPSTNKKT